jgi:ATP-dependent Zn protease
LIENQRSRSRQRPLSHSDSIETSNDVINLLRQSNELKSVKNLSLRQSSKTNSVNEENTNQIKFFIFHREEKLNQLQQFIKNIRSEWNELICKPSKLSIWIILSIFILSSIILGCKFFHY